MSVSVGGGKKYKGEMSKPQVIRWRHPDTPAQAELRHDGKIMKKKLEVKVNTPTNITCSLTQGSLGNGEYRFYKMGAWAYREIPKIPGSDIATIEESVNREDKYVCRAVLVIDGMEMLGDFSQELNVKYTGAVKTCPKKQLQCDDGDCYKKKQRCDGNQDCGDNSDEKGCVEKPKLKVSPKPKNFTLPNGKNVKLTCTTKNSKVSVFKFYLDDVEVHNVTTSPGTTKASYSLTPVTPRDTGAYTCRVSVDGTDSLESNEEYFTVICRKYEFQCFTSPQCVGDKKDNKTCDQTNDCDDGSDESVSVCGGGKTTKKPGNCPKGSKECTLFGGCYTAAQECDGEPQCDDFSDETGCT